MANKEHLEILKKGVAAWNQWRNRDLALRPDLSGANLSSLFAREITLHGIVGLRMGGGLDNVNFGNVDLSHADLSCVGLMDARLVGADRSHVNLSEAILSGSDLSRDDLHGANLREAELQVVNLHDAGLTQADLSGAQLVQTIFDQTRLSGAKFNGSTMAYTLFGNVDLSDSEGLEAVNHVAPSTIGIDTIYLSKGRIPEVFLRGAGVPDTVITYMKSVVVEPIAYYSCFISYSSTDEEFARRLHRDLQGEHVRCWFAPHDVRGGRKLYEQIDQAIHLQDRVLLVLSPHSMNSEWVKTEIAKARKRELQEKRQVLFPIRLTSFELIRVLKCFAAELGKGSAREIREYFIPDFSNWKDHDNYQEAFGGW